MNSSESSTQAYRPLFPKSINTTISNFKTGESYQFQGGADVVFTEEDIQRLVEICNQKEIYDFLFGWRMGGKPYTEENARWFANSFAQGWKDSSHFIFIIRNTSNLIVGAIDIKSADSERAEVGYWADNQSSGFITNALIEMSSHAKIAGYKKLFAKVVLGNEKSENVLKRGGFEMVGTEEVGERKYSVFEKVL